ncbi:hypothetical protein I546_4962 [Mycobacterium kansasii 732]|nr:hypothetical protein I546_4962 [Mycobacterium kansasii 732]
MPWCSAADPPSGSSPGGDNTGPTVIDAAPKRGANIAEDDPVSGPLAGRRPTGHPRITIDPPHRNRHNRKYEDSP